LVVEEGNHIRVGESTKNMANKKRVWGKGKPLLNFDDVFDRIKYLQEEGKSKNQIIAILAEDYDITYDDANDYFMGYLASSG